MASKIAMGINLILGGVLTGFTLNIMEKTRKCSDTSFRRALEGILVISVSIFVASVAYIVSKLKCKCEEKESKYLLPFVSIYFILLGITLVVLGIIVHVKSKGECASARIGAIVIWSLGIVIVLASAGYYASEKVLEDKEKTKLF
jgi:cytochrome bd-type quinol oxidase subunit 2